MNEHIAIVARSPKVLTLRIDFQRSNRKKLWSVLQGRHTGSVTLHNTQTTVGFASSARELHSLGFLGSFVRRAFLDLAVFFQETVFFAHRWHMIDHVIHRLMESFCVLLGVDSTDDDHGAKA